MGQDRQHHMAEAATRWFGKTVDTLGGAERHVLDLVLARRTLAGSYREGASTTLTFGQRMADKVASFGGSWTFIGLFALFLLVWSLLNLWWLLRPFDPYPFIFLNLILSMLAAVQAPIIMMSQNRMAVRDRLDAAHDYQVNLKAEIEIMALHEKLDEMRSQQIETLLATQQRQLDMLTQLLTGQRAPGPHA